MLYFIKFSLKKIREDVIKSMNYQIVYNFISYSEQVII